MSHQLSAFLHVRITDTRRVSSTISALSSIARLSIGMTMSVPSQLCVSTDGDLPAAASGTPVVQVQACSGSWCASADDECTNGDRSRGAATTAAAAGRYHRYSFPQCSESSVTSLPVAMTMVPNRLRKAPTETAVSERHEPRSHRSARSRQHRNPFTRCVGNIDGDEDTHVADQRIVGAAVSGSGGQQRQLSYDSGRDYLSGAQTPSAMMLRRNCFPQAVESMSSPVNSTGVQIVIDSSVEDDDSVLVVLDNNNAAAAAPSAVEVWD